MQPLQQMTKEKRKQISCNLGKYVIKETKAPEGYLLNPKEFEVTLAYKDQTTEIVYGDVTVPNQPDKRTNRNFEKR